MNQKQNQVQLQNIKQPKNVKVLILAENKTSIKEFYHIKKYINLIKIDLSYNKLTSFPAGFSFSYFLKLRTLHLHYNKFSTLKHLAPVTQCPNLAYLTLFGNPLEEAKARHFFVNEMHSLMLMDTKIVRIQERNQDLNITEKQIQLLAYPLFKQPNQQDTAAFLQNVIKQLAIVRKSFLRANPIIKIQRWWKHLYRLKHRKWEITTLREMRAITPYDIKHHKDEMQRLVTQTIQINKSFEDKVTALIVANGQLWQTFRSIVGDGQMYLSKKYCIENAIQFEQIQQLKVYRHYGHLVRQAQGKKRHLIFFISYHDKIIASNAKNMHNNYNQSLCSIKIKYPRQKIQLNSQKFAINDRKLEDLDKRYKQYYVIPKLQKDQIMNIAKKQYFKFIKNSITNIFPDQFPFLSKVLLSRCLAAVTIQRVWRGFKVRKSVDPIVNIRKTNAAIKIQRWIRTLKFQHRYKFLLQVGNYLKKQKNSNEIVLQTCQIPAIEQYCNYKQKLGVNFLINFQQCNFAISKIQNISHFADFSACKITFYSQRKPYPAYFNLLTFKSQPFLPKNLENKQEHKDSSIMQILFKEAKTINTIIDSKGDKYIKFTYSSQEQTLNRKFILALKTYRMLNHQFITSMSSPIVPNNCITNVIDVINQNKLITFKYQKDMPKNEKSQVQNKILQKQKSYQSLHTDFNMIGDSIHIKIKFFLVTQNYNGTIILKSPNYSKSNTLHSHANFNLNLQNYYLGRKRTISKRYEQDHIESISKISRNIMSLDQFQQRNIKTHKPVQVYQKILTTDQSHSIIDSLSPKSSLNRLQMSHKFESYDKFDREVYPSMTYVARESLMSKKQINEIQSLRSKKQLINEIKQSHRQKITDIVNKKYQNLSHLRREISKQHQQNGRKISQARQGLEQQKIRKHDRIKQKIKFSSDNFESQFMKKGIKSIKKEMRDNQRKSMSFRQHAQSQIKHSILPSPPHKTKSKPIRYQMQRTQIKQFSINISEGEMSMKITETGKQIMRSQQQKQSIVHFNKSNKSQSPQDRLKSDKSDSIIIYNDQFRQPRAQKNDQLQIERKKLRKKRLVHSVFPEQFYPLKRSNQIGFQLPKISKK